MPYSAPATPPPTRFLVIPSNARDLHVRIGADPSLRSGRQSTPEAMLLLQAADSTAAMQVRHAVDVFASNLLDYALALAAVGALAMALIELFKKLLDSRTKFHAKRWTAWMK